MTFRDSEAGCVLLGLIETIQTNAAYLSDIDGMIGDGDHGINMNKGFTLCETRLEGREYSMSEGLLVLSATLMEDIGGSMGPLYGVFFEEISAACAEVIDAKAFEGMLKAALQGIRELGNADRGDKTLLDTLIPGIEAFSGAIAGGRDFAAALDALKDGAKAGWESTEDMVAKVGRASRLGERSRGVLDAGATSCYLLLSSMADSIQGILK